MLTGYTVVVIFVYFMLFFYVTVPLTSSLGVWDVWCSLAWYDLRSACCPWQTPWERKPHTQTPSPPTVQVTSQQYIYTNKTAVYWYDLGNNIILGS